MSSQAAENANEKNAAGLLTILILNSRVGRPVFKKTAEIAARGVMGLPKGTKFTGDDWKDAIYRFQLLTGYQMYKPNMVEIERVLENGRRQHGDGSNVSGDSSLFKSKDFLPERLNDLRDTWFTFGLQMKPTYSSIQQTIFIAMMGCVDSVCKSGSFWISEKELYSRVSHNVFALLELDFPDEPMPPNEFKNLKRKWNQFCRENPHDFPSPYEIEVIKKQLVDDYYLLALQGNDGAVYYAVGPYASDVPKRLPCDDPHQITHVKLAIPFMIPLQSADEASSGHHCGMQHMQRKRDSGSVEVDSGSSDDGDGDEEWTVRGGRGGKKGRQKKKLRTTTDMSSVGVSKWKKLVDSDDQSLDTTVPKLAVLMSDKTLTYSDCRHIQQELKKSIKPAGLLQNLLKNRVFRLYPKGQDTTMPLLNWHVSNFSEIGKENIQGFSGLNRGKCEFLVEMLGDIQLSRIHHLPEQDIQSKAERWANRLSSMSRNMGSGRIQQNGSSTEISLKETCEVVNFSRALLLDCLGYKEPMKTALDLGHGSGKNPLVFATLGGFEEAYGLELCGTTFRTSLGHWKQSLKEWDMLSSRPLNVALVQGDILKIQRMEMDFVFGNLRGLVYKKNIPEESDYYKIAGLINRSPKTKVIALGSPSDHAKGYFPEYVDEYEWKHHVPLCQISAHGRNEMSFTIFVNKICFPREKGEVPVETPCDQMDDNAICSSEQCPLQRAVKLMETTLRSNDTAFDYVGNLLEESVNKERSTRSSGAPFP